MKKELVTVSVSELVPYENNPRLNDAAVGQVAESIKQVGYITPIIIDEDGVILAGHTRLKALQAQGVESVEVIRVTGMKEQEKRKFRLLDNKTGEAAGWDLAKLEEELKGLDFEGFDFGFIYNDLSEPVSFSDEEEKAQGKPTITITFDNVKDYKDALEKCNEIGERYNGIVSVGMK